METTDIIEISKHYTTRREFRLLEPRAYNAASAAKLLDKLAWLKKGYKKKDGIPSDEELLEKSKKYSSFVELRENDRLLDKKLYNRKLYNRITWLSKVRKPYTKTKERRSNIPSDEELLEKSKKYSSVKKLKETDKLLYERLIRHNLLDKATWLEKTSMMTPHKRYEKLSLEEIIDVASKCSTYKEFRTEHRHKYEIALRNKWLDLLPIKSACPTPLTYADIYNEAIKYSTLYDFRVNSPRHYQCYARHKEWVFGWLSKKQQPKRYGVEEAKDK